MIELTSYLPLRIMRFPNQECSDTDVETVALGEVTSTDDGVTELAFNIGRKRYYIGIRHADLPMLTPPKDSAND